MTLVPGGPVLIEGPVEMVLPDGTAVRSDRPVVALCACRRSKRFPFCDTSHRERAQPTGPTGPTGKDQPAAANGDSSED